MAVVHTLFGPLTSQNGSALSTMNSNEATTATAPTSLISNINPGSDNTSLIYGERLDTRRQQIRLLRLERGDWADPIVCQLERVFLRERKLTFEAISYVWGDTRDRDNLRSVTLNGLPHTVTSNLEDALRNFRYTDKQRVLWADAICMNQTDTLERADQVTLMREIYRKAEGVLVWLGNPPNPTNPDDNSTSAERPDICSWKHPKDSSAEDVARVNQYLQQFARFHRVPDFMRHKMNQDYDMVTYCVIYLLAKDYHLPQIFFLRGVLYRHNILQVLTRIMHVPWWGRLWVVQETVLAQKATLVYGRFSAPWKMFSMAARNYETHRVGCCASQHAELEPNIVTAFSEFSRAVLILEELRKMWKKGLQRSLLPLLWQFRNRRTGNFRDKVFALLPLVDYWGQESAFLPNYDWTLQEVYREILIKLCEVYNNLTPLVGNAEKHPEHNLASWIPDWSVEPRPFEFERLGRAHLYSASRSVPPKTIFHSDDVMQVEGFLHDTVKQVGDLMPADDKSDAQFKTFTNWESIVGLESNSNAQYPGEDHEIYLHAYWRVLCLDSEYQIDENDPTKRKHKYVLTNNQYVRQIRSLLASQPVERASTSTQQIPSPSNRAVQTTRPQRTETHMLWPDINNTNDTGNTSRSGEFSRPAVASAMRTMTFLSAMESDDMSMPEESNFATAVDHAVKSATSDQRLFRTAKGYIGLGPRSTEESDEVFILAGGSTPFLLRPAGGKDIKAGRHACHTLVGDCYVHGIMYGEAMADYESKKTDIYLI